MSERPRGYGESASAGAADERPRISTTLIVLTAGVLVCALGGLVALVVLDVGGDAAIAGGAAAGAVGLFAAGLLTRALARMRRAQSQLARREADALRMAELDDLTGLGNYRMFTRQLAAEVARSRRHDDPFSLVLLDLDGFKEVNDELGHLAGDDALRLVAAALRGALREEDLCCRQGGDEFAVIAVRAAEEEARDLGERLVRAIEGIEFGSGERRLSASVGWATFGYPARSVDELVLRADSALRQSKRANGGAMHASAGAAAPTRRERGGRLGRPETTRLALLSGLARALAGARDERTLAETTVAFLAGGFDTVGAAVVASGSGAEVRLAALSSGAPEATEAETAAALAQRPIAMRALAAGGVAVVEDDVERRWVDGSEVHSELAVAVMEDGLAWGWISLACERSRAYDLGERALAEAIAAQLGRALTCRRLLDRLRDAGFGELYRVAVGSAAASETEAWRIAELSWQVGRALGLGDADLRALYLAALFHDVGTVGVPAVLLSHPGDLHEEERAVVREHATIGERLLRTLPLLCEAAPIVRHEHEHYDGLGYPDGLVGEEIPLPARVLLACDTLVSMTSPRPWRPARSLDAARAELERVAGSQLDPRVVAALLEALDAGVPSGGNGERPPSPAQV
ncbi:MAG TPA: diguanylate cyclase [Conexibacter sp.]|nr:diguanylate cyclase [Conexibacter sp.]